MAEHSFAICRAGVSADRGGARKPRVDRRPFFASAATRTVLAAAIALAAVIASPHAARADHCKFFNCHQTTGDGTTQHFFTVQFAEGRVASAALQQFAAALGKELASANVSKDDIAAVVDDAVRQLANWNGAAPLRFFWPRIGHEVIVAFERSD